MHVVELSLFDGVYLDDLDRAVRMRPGLHHDLLPAYARVFEDGGQGVALQEGVELPVPRLQGESAGGRSARLPPPRNSDVGLAAAAAGWPGAGASRVRETQARERIKALTIFI